MEAKWKDKATNCFNWLNHGTSPLWVFARVSAAILSVVCHESVPQSQSSVSQPDTRRPMTSAPNLRHDHAARHYQPPEPAPTITPVSLAKLMCLWLWLVLCKMLRWTRERLLLDLEHKIGFLGGFYIKLQSNKINFMIFKAQNCDFLTMYDGFVSF